MENSAAQQLLRLAQQRHLAGDLPGAAQLYQQLLADQPDQPDALHLLGLIHYQSGDAATAREMMVRSIALKPSVPYFHKNLGEVCRNLGKLDESIATFQKAIALAPDDGSAYYGLGQAQEKLGDDGKALASYRTAAQLSPNDAPSHLNYGVLMEREGRYAEARAQFDIALRLRPNYPTARVAQALSQFRSGDLPAGFANYDWRWKEPKFPGKPVDPDHPLWDGAPLAGKTIMVRAEQGLGDTLQFVRYVPMVVGRGGRVIFEVQPLLYNLLNGQGGLGLVMPAGRPAPAYDVQVPMMSLPGRFGTTLAQIPAPIPYLNADPNLVEQWRQRLALDRNLKVGLAWAGNSRFPGDKRRSTSLVTFAPLASVKDVTFYSLQVGPQAEQAKRPPEGMRLVDLSSDLRDFTVTAAVVSQLDLLIAVDTSVVHLAGAMGRPVWVLIPFVPDWRWFLDREDSPWYPTVRLFRQKRLDDWSDPVARITERLGELSRKAVSGLVKLG